MFVGKENGLVPSLWRLISVGARNPLLRERAYRCLKSRLFLIALVLIFGVAGGEKIQWALLTAFALAVCTIGQLAGMWLGYSTPRREETLEVRFVPQWGVKMAARSRMLVTAITFMALGLVVYTAFGYMPLAMHSQEDVEDAIAICQAGSALAMGLLILCTLLFKLVVSEGYYLVGPKRQEIPWPVPVVFNSPDLANPRPEACSNGA